MHFSAQCYWPDCSFDAVVIQLDATVRQKQAQAVPVFSDVFQRFTQRSICEHAGAGRAYELYQRMPVVENDV